MPDGSLNPEALELQPDSGEPALVDDVVIPARSTWRCYDTGDAPPDQRNHSKVSWGARFYNDYDWSEKIAADGFSNKEVYLRKSFVLESLADIKSASLELLKGSGTVYLNGSVVRPGSFQSSLLRQGRNLLTVAANNSAAGFDLSLTLSRDTAFWTAAAIPAAGANTWVKARALQNNDWSALSEYDGRDLSQQANSFLRVTEMMYSAEVSEEEALQGYTHDDFAWIELQNSSERWMNLAGAGFTEGIEYTFPDMLLAPGAYLVLCKNPGAFATRYDIRQMQLMGPYKGNLARKGEHHLSAADGSSILSYTYSNSWYPRPTAEATPGRNRRNRRRAALEHPRKLGAEQRAPRHPGHRQGWAGRSTAPLSSRYREGARQPERPVGRHRHFQRNRHRHCAAAISVVQRWPAN